MPGDDPEVDDGVVDEASGVTSGLSVELSPLELEVAKDRYGPTAGDNNCEGEPKTSLESELTSRSAMAGVCRSKSCSLKPSHTSDVPS